MRRNLKLNKSGWMIGLALAALSIPSARAVTVMGYVDTDYRMPNLSNSSDGTFDVTTLSLLFSHEIDIYRFFAELEAAPTGSDTTTPSLERAWVEADFSPYASLKFGKEVSPTLWQLNHYPHIVMPFTRPLMVRNVFKEYLSGIQLFGKDLAGFKYYAWAQNNDNVVTANNTVPGGQSQSGGNSLANPGRPSIGGKLGWEGKAAMAKFDVSGLIAHYNDNTLAGTTSMGPFSAYGAEANISVEHAKIWSEWAIRKYESNAPVTQGFYAIGSYGFTFGDMELSPYFLYDSMIDPTGQVANQFNVVTGATTQQNRYAYGLNFKPNANIVTKLEYLKGSSANKADGTLVPDYSQLALQFVYFFN